MRGIVKVAAIQMNCIPGMIQENLDHAEKLIKQAVDKGAEVILLPELMPCGYMATEEIWDFAETVNGPSIHWLTSMAGRFKIHLGFTYLEAEGEDFYNSFVLAGPEGKLLGRVRKDPPASIEAYFYKAGSDRHVIDTEHGRIGVGICYENLLYKQMCSLYGENVDLILSPFAAGRPKPFIPGDIKRFDDLLINSRAVFAKTLGVPVVMANRVGPLDTDLPGNMPHLKSSFPGLSSIVDYDGTVQAELGSEEAVIVADVHTGHCADRKSEPKLFGKMWGVPVPWYAFIWPMSQKWGEKSYAANMRRKERALSVSGSVKIP
ncbi:carbon-nitrogen hydrolase family protein [Mariprofundus ferrooxydans]|uniref:carbon-nitrogen hydrolase family protein n=1 Tax=Mariprofundus ferrooxydans TaxID=314344 RepID=UPI00035F3951|nr:carbon-nitrogen hydrolase family protein [Mariprofundus ferrooxydans]